MLEKQTPHMKQKPFCSLSKTLLLTTLECSPIRQLTNELFHSTFSSRISLTFFPWSLECFPCLVIIWEYGTRNLYQCLATAFFHFFLVPFVLSKQLCLSGVRTEAV